MMNSVVLIFSLSLLFTGVFHEYLSCILSSVLLGWLFFKVKQSKKMIVKKSMTSIAIGILCLFYGISALWAVDFGMAIVGFFKFLPIGLFLLCLMQEEESADKMKKLLPYLASGMTIVSLAGMYIPKIAFRFSVAGRLAGFFEYPNTFALFLLVSELLLLSKENKKNYDYLMFIVLGVGILFTGSRTAFVLAIAANLLLAVLLKGKKAFGLCLRGCILAGVILTFNQELLQRFLTISTSESTFVGRLLYFQDALPVILRKPLGTGFLGHYFMQQSIQTGVYSVRYLHNDFLQILIDIGWIPFLLMVIAVIKTMCNKKRSLGDKVILGVMILHSSFDFNLQFISMFCLLVLFLDWQEGKTIILQKSAKRMQAGFVVAAVLSVYMAVGLICMRAGDYKLANHLQPWNTENNIMLLTQTDDVDEMAELAQKIINKNEYVTLAYSALAKQAYSQGDFGQVIQYKNHIFEIAPFQYEEYEDYCYMLVNGYSLYKEAGDMQSAQICKEEIFNTKNRLDNLDERLSERGRKIKDQPVQELPEELEMYIQRME